MTSKLTAEELGKLEQRLESRLPIVGTFVRRRALVLLAEDDSPDAYALLARAAAQNPDAKVREQALSALDAAGDQSSINAICRVWFEIRHPVLDALLQAKRWVATRPWDVRVFSALKVGALNDLKVAGDEAVGPLLLASEDSDPDIKNSVQGVLRNLEATQAREALCRLLIERDFPIARAVVVDKGFYPDEPVTRALFFFLTEQWDRYEALDFDQRLLRLAYEGASESVRRRVLEKLRLTGRTDFLTVIVGRDYRDRIAQMTPEELDFVVYILRTNRDWERLYALAFEVPLAWSVRILGMLSEVSWQPPEADRELFANLMTLIEARVITDSQALLNAFPRAVLQARLRAPGRINDVAFSPHDTLLAVGTGTRKVVLWNYQTAHTGLLLSGFEHSVGHVTFTQDGQLVCAERTNRTSGETGIYGWDGDQLRRMGVHQGPVTALESVTGSRALSAGRDNDVALWDVATGVSLARYGQTDWPRSACVAPQGDAMLVLMRRRAEYRSIEDASLIAYVWFPSAPSCGAFLSELEVLIGRHNGALTAFRRVNNRQTRKLQDLPAHASTVEGIEVLPRRGCLLTAGREGEVRFYRLSDRVRIGTLVSSGEGLTTLHVSRDEAFMALGHADATFSLWDLRGPDVSALLVAPLSSISSLSLGILDAFANNLKLEASARRAAAYAALVVRHRTRFDIELEAAAPTIMAGDFDIEIEG